MLVLTLIVGVAKPLPVYSKQAALKDAKISLAASQSQSAASGTTEAPKEEVKAEAKTEATAVKTAETKVSTTATTQKTAATVQPKTTTTKRATTTSTTSRSQTTTTTTKAATTTSSANTATSTKASAVISTAKQYIGVRYSWGGTTPSGFDCSGFTSYVFAKNGITLPRISRDQYNVGTAVAFSNLKAGDLVFFSMDGDKVIDHVGIFMGGGQFIHASSTKGVTISSMSSYWTGKMIGSRRVL